MRHAVAAALVATASSNVALAVQLGNGTGQVLVYPYYTVRGGYNTLVTVVNNRAETKAVKVRFLEGKNSREVLQLNLFLSPNDVWVAAIVATTDGARLVSNDNSCVLPVDLFTETRKDSNNLYPNDFKNASYTGANADSSQFQLLDRTREGFFEVIEMGVIDPTLSITATTVNGFIKQNSAGVPANCAALTALDPVTGNSNPNRFPNTGAMMMSPPQGGLSGRLSLINSQTGANYSFNATALDAWSDKVAYAAVGDAGPSLADASPKNSVVIAPTGAVAAQWTTGQDAVSAVLMRESLTGEFILDGGTASQTDWVVTFPTKRYYSAAGNGSATPPFAKNFNGLEACDPLSQMAYDREVKALKLNCSDASTCPPPIVSFPGALCWAANTIPFGVAGLLRSTNTRFLESLVQSFVNNAVTTAGESATPVLRGTQGPNGVYRVQFDNVATAPLQKMTPLAARRLFSTGATDSIPGSHYGMPAIGLMLHNYQNSGVTSRYGGTLEPANTVRVE